MPTLRHRRRARYVGVALTPLLLLTACGDDDEASGQTEAEENPELAEQVNLKPEDLPEGYQPGPVAEPASGERQQDPFLQCLGAQDTYPDRIVDEGDSPDYNHVDDEAQTRRTVSSSTTVYDEAATAEELFNALESENLTDCARQQFEQAFAAAPPDVMQFEVTDLNVDGAFPTYGEETVKLAGTISLTAEGQTESANMGLTFVRTGRVISTLITSGFPEAFPNDVLQQLAQTVADRQGQV